jgi:hypothetical protein
MCGSKPGVSKKACCIFIQAMASPAEYSFTGVPEFFLQPEEMNKVLNGCRMAIIPAS